MRRVAGKNRADTVEKGAVSKARGWKAGLQCDLGPISFLLGVGIPLRKMEQQGRVSPEGFTWEPRGRLFTLGLLLRSTSFLTAPGGQ